MSNIWIQDNYFFGNKQPVRINGKYTSLTDWITRFMWIINLFAENGDDNILLWVDNAEAIGNTFHNTQ